MINALSDGKTVQLSTDDWQRMTDRLETAENFLDRLHETDQEWRVGTLSAQEAMVTVAAISGAWRSANPRAQQRT